MMSEQEIGKKEIEMMELLPFLDARKFITGEILSLIVGFSTENPDFICVHDEGQLIGVELTKVTEEHEKAIFDRIKYGEVQIDQYRTKEIIKYLIERKEKARSQRYTEKATENILVLQLVNGSFDQLKEAFDGLQGEFNSHGFTEIWIADYSGLEVYGDIELFGLYPPRWWGRHCRSWPDQKPYG